LLSCLRRQQFGTTFDHFSSLTGLANAIWYSVAYKENAILQISDPTVEAMRALTDAMTKKERQVLAVCRINGDFDARTMSAVP
jgi:hypothetical protein